MNPKLFKAMRAKKKREVDPNAPPRPNLMTHNVKIRGIEDTVSQMEQQLAIANARVEALERKLQNQTAYLQSLHNAVSGIRKR
jgi:phage shock protein A